MIGTQSFEMVNGDAVSLGDVPRVGTPEFRAGIVRAVAEGARIAALFGGPGEAGQPEIFAVLADDAAGALAVVRTAAVDGYPAITLEAPQAHWFERELWEQTGIVPIGHPWLKKVRFEPLDASGRTPDPQPGVVPFFRVEGEPVHEVAVGPVHAGVIEPGHFRFQCLGETVMHLEIELGYQHRGVERAMAGGPHKRAIHYAETLAGDTTIGHATAYCEAVEALAGAGAPPRAQALRAIALELERLANHAGDLGALAGDVGFQPTQAACGRLRGDFLNMTALVCGSRFGRGLVRPGGVGFDLDDARVAELRARLDRAMAEIARPAALLWDTASVLARFEETGALTGATAVELGLVGPAARACGVARDVRYAHPSGMYRFAQVPVSTWTTGDVFARAYVRWLEMQRSAAFIRRQLETLPAGAVRAAVDAGALAPSHVAVTLAEGWRGEICHVAVTGPDGRLARYKVVDPSFHNWFGLAQALRNQAISDFPLCNKSFNLSYCGHDL